MGTTIQNQPAHPPSPTLPASFEGELEVDPPDFPAELRPLIVRSDGVAFTLKGQEKDGDDWVIDGVASPRGRYFESPILPMKFTEVESDAVVRVRIESISGAECSVRMVLIQDNREDQTWTMTGKLEATKQA